MMIGMTKVRTIFFVLLLGIALAITCAMFARCYISYAAAPLATASDPVASPSDPVDDYPYLTYKGVEGQPLQTNQILLSIRNVLIMILGFQILIWTHARMTVIVKRLHSKKRGD